jgi:hypothetical protein
MENITQQFIRDIEEICQKYKINNTQINKIVNKNIYIDKFWSIEPDEIKKLRENYKIIDVDWLDPVLVDYQMFGDKYFNENKDKKQIVNAMMDYYLSHKDRPIYKKTDYLCNRKEKICICNVHAHDFRKIYDKNNYKPDDNYISWIKKTSEPF